MFINSTLIFMLRCTPPLLLGGEMDQPFVVRVTKKRNQAATLRTSRRTIEKHDRVDLRAMGAAVALCVEMANKLVNTSHGELRSHARTYSVPVNVPMPTGHFAEGQESQQHEQRVLQYTSGLSVIVFRGEL